MASVTQRIPNFLGGVSQQIDTLKRPNQLRVCLNAYPDATFGLIKRSGGRFVAELKNAGGTLYAPGFFDDGKWFSIFRDKTEQYVGVIKGSGIYIWDIQTGAPKTVTMVGSAASYLTGTKPEDYHLLSINDFTYITNRTKTVTTQALPAAWINNKAFISLRAIVSNSSYKVTINGSTATYSTPASGALDVSTVISGIITAINGLSISGLTATAVGPGIYLSRSSSFSISVNGGLTGDALEVFQNAVPNVSKLPTQSVQGYVVRVANTSSEDDDYYVEFAADNNVSGPGVWIETIKPDVTKGLTASTMPHELVRLANGTFEFRQVPWEDRLVGDDVSNPVPSFVGTEIQQLFFYRNRLGVLTFSTVVLSQAGDYFNYFGSSALTSVDADPIDVATSTTKPAAMRAVVPVAQGLVLFSSGEQFLLTSSTDSLSPGSVVVKSISRYQYDIENDPADLGVTTAFITKSSSYSRVFEMETLGTDNAPYVNDISKVVPEWIPNTVNQIVGSGQSSLLALASSDSREVWLFQFLSDGQKRLKEGWFQWRLSGTVQHQAIENDVYWAVTKQQSSYVIQSINLIQSPATSTLQVTDGSRVDPRLDLWKTNATAVLSGSDTKVYLPFAYDSFRSLRVVIANSTTSGPDYSNSGAVFSPTTIAQDGGGWYAVIPNLNLTSENLIIGYTFNYRVELPRIYYRTGEELNATDYTAYLTIARIKFNFGLSGDINLRVTALGRPQWDTLAGVKKLDYYKLNDIPFIAEGVFTLPIHQRTENFTVSITSESPFPVSLISAMWEGNYSPQFYTRRS
jgi:hypothetical protein